MKKKTHCKWSGNAIKSAPLTAATLRKSMLNAIKAVEREKNMVVEPFILTSVKNRDILLNALKLISKKYGLKKSVKARRRLKTQTPPKKLKRVVG